MSLTDNDWLTCQRYAIGEQTEEQITARNRVSSPVLLGIAALGLI